MSLIITYKDNDHHHAVQCDEITTKATRDFIQALMLYPSDFDLLQIDLSDYIEAAVCYLQGRRICSFGGAHAWSIYRSIATIWTEINYHTAGRPAVIL